MDAIMCILQAYITTLVPGLKSYKELYHKATPDDRQCANIAAGIKMY